MRYYLLLLALQLTMHASGQVKDRRARLEFEGMVNEISVAPDETVWLTTDWGEICYSQKNETTWHRYASLPALAGNPRIDRISFFNKDTAIMTGEMSSHGEWKTNNGYYRTTDGGRSWSLLAFPANDWIYGAFVNRAGDAWLASSTGVILYSHDYGLHWERLRSWCDSTDHVSCIYMRNGQSGIANTFSNTIYVTSDNWVSAKKIPTPFDQMEPAKKKGKTDPAVIKVLPWNNFLVARQNGLTYYTDTGYIDWKRFPANIKEFALAGESNELFALNDSNEALVFVKPLQYHFFCAGRCIIPHLDMKVVNGTLYLIDFWSQVCRITSKGIVCGAQYTTDEQIEDPKVIREGTGFTWGLSGNELYRSDKGKPGWFRESTLPFYAKDIWLLNDSTVILWTGKDNYSYSLTDHKATPYYQATPLRDFLTSRIKRLLIVSRNATCLGNISDSLVYELRGDKILAATRFVDGQSGNQRAVYRHQVSSTDLSGLLAAINTNESAMPSLKDFNITARDKENYIGLAEERLRLDPYSSLTGYRKIDREFYYSVPAKLDTLSNGILAKVLRQHNNNFGKNRLKLYIELVTVKGDTLTVSANSEINPVSWNLPWRFRHKGINFLSYNVGFSKFISSCMREGFPGKVFFDNRLLIMEIADYLWEQEQDR